MDTQNPTTSKLPSIRTYAKDLESKRKEKNLPPLPEAVTPVVETPAPKESFLKKKPKVVTMPPIVVSTKTEPEKKPTEVPRPPVKKIDAATLSAFNTKNTTFIVDNEDAAAATIITDTKRDRFKFFPALIASMKGWFADKKQSYKAKKQPKYTVADTSRRKGVIQRATGVTGKLASSDFSSIHERIKQREEEKEEASHTTWSAKTEPGFLLLETSKKAAVANVQFVSKKSFRTTPKEILVEPKKVETVPVVEIRKVEPTIEEVIPAPEIVTPIETVAEPLPSEPIIITPEETPAEEAPTSRLGSILLTNTNTLSLIISGVVLALTLCGTYMYFTLGGEEGEVVALSRSEVTRLIPATQELKVLTPVSKVAAFEILVDVRSSLDDTTQIGLVSQTEELLTPQVLLPLLSSELEQPFVNTISQIRFGYTKERQPFLLLQAADLATAKGGMLAWEQTLGEDFNSLYGITGVAFQSKFIDATLSGIDVRVLKTESGTERLLYGISGNLIFITTQSADFTELLTLNNR